MKLMILGAGVYQVPLIKKAKAMGHETFVVSPIGNYPGLTIADKVVDCDTRDKKAVLNAAIEFGIDGIVTTGTDVAVPAIGYVVDRLNLHGTGFESSQKCMNKSLMKKCFLEHFIQTADYRVVQSLEELKVVANEIGYPLMVKAVDSSGSRGITKVESESGLKAAFEESLLVSNVQDVIVEQFLDGYEIGAQAIVSSCEVEEVFLHSDIVTSPPISVPIGHTMPLRISEPVSEKTRLLIKRAVKALGVKDTISNVDIMIVDGEPYLLEIGARMGATCLPENISIYNRFDVYEYLVNLALGFNPKLDLSTDKQPNAALLLCSDKTGVVKEIIVPNLVYQNENLIDLTLDVSVGDRVSKFNVGPDRIGQIVTIGETESEAIKLARELSSQIVISVE
jgi:biotin carboxylase